MEEKIFFDDVSKSFKIKQKKECSILKAVDNLSFSISSGEILGLIGLNGSGKTTTIKMACGVMKPDSGTILIENKNPFKRSMEYRKKVSLIMGQKSRLNPDLSILDSIMMYSSFYSIPPKTARNKTIEFSGIIDLSENDLNKQVRKLSLGQRMKGELTLAFIHNPKIVFLDEPTLGLDFLTQRKIRDFIKDYCREKDASMILTSHYINDIETLSDRILLIDKGRKLFYGTTDQLKNLVPDNSTISFDCETDINSHLEGFNYSVNENSYILKINSNNVESTIQSILKNCRNIRNLSVNKIGLEEVIETVFKGE